MDREQVKAWVEAAKEDGWERKPTYVDESVDSAATLTKYGWLVMVLLRDHQAGISAWTPDKVWVKAPKVYSWDALWVNAQKCMYCGELIDELYVVAFANRACQKCGQVEQAKLPRGWSE